MLLACVCVIRSPLIYSSPNVFRCGSVLYRGISLMFDCDDDSELFVGYLVVVIATSLRLGMCLFFGEEVLFRPGNMCCI